MSRIPRSLAHRIDRLSRHAHAFHRFAHHPLCGRYEGELVRLGAGSRGTRACLGCTLALSGTAVGLVAGLFLPVPGALAAVLAAVVGVLWPGFQGKARTRLLPAALLAAAFGAGLRAPQGLVVSGVALACGLALLWAYRRRGPDREACRTCPELSTTVPCSGVQPILHREAAFRRLTVRWLDAAPAVSASPSSRRGAAPAVRSAGAAPYAP
jgi:hypothetical protein